MPDLTELVSDFADQRRANRAAQLDKPLQSASWVKGATTRVRNFVDVWRCSSSVEVQRWDAASGSSLEVHLASLIQQAITKGDS